MERRRRQERRVQERDGRRGCRAFPAAVRRKGSIGGERAGGAGSDAAAFAGAARRKGSIGGERAGGAGSAFAAIIAAVRRKGSIGGERAGGAAADENGPGKTEPDAGDGAAGPLAGVAERQGGAIAAFAVAEVGVARAARGAGEGSCHRERFGADAERDRGVGQSGAVRFGSVTSWARSVDEDEAQSPGSRRRRGSYAEVQAGKSQRGFHRVTPSFINTNERQADHDGRRGDSRRCKHPSKSRLNAVDSNTRQSRG